MTYAFWDTNLFIYQWDTTSVFRPSVRALREKVLEAGVGLVTSAMTLGEVMAKPRKDGNEVLAQQYRTAVLQASTVVSFDEETADLYAHIRAQTNVRRPDGIQLASAAKHGVELFITNDKDLWKLRISGIHFIVSIETALTLIR